MRHIPLTLYKRAYFDWLSVCTIFIYPFCSATLFIYMRLAPVALKPQPKRQKPFYPILLSHIYVAEYSPNLIKMEPKWLTRIAPLVQLALLASVFDIYFRSPVVPSSRSFSARNSAQNAPAKRVVLFVADGLRADAIYSARERAPFLYSVAEGIGAWGVSHTR